MSYGMQGAAPVIVFEGKGKDEAQDEGITGENEPDAMPVFNPVDSKMVYHPAATHPSQESPQPIGHDHEQSLGTGPDGDRRLFFDEEGTGDIEKVEGHSVDDHGEHKEGKSATRVADAEEAKAEHPGEDAHQHYFFDTKPIEEKRNGEDEQGLGDL